jgi:hypothetical protein
MLERQAFQDGRYLARSEIAAVETKKDALTKILRFSPMTLAENSYPDKRLGRGEHAATHGHTPCGCLSQHNLLKSGFHFAPTSCHHFLMSSSAA